MDDNQTVKLENVRASEGGSKLPVLIVLQGGNLGTSIPLRGKSVTIGRGSDCDIRLDDNLASRQHAMVRLGKEGGAFGVLDLGSTNGTFVNGQLVEDPYPLTDGDKIRVGRHVFKFALLDEYETEFQERIHQMIIRDDLTNLLTQRSFFVELESQLSRRNAEPNPGTLCVLMMDLDHFKSVNDNYGHLVGSQTIKQIGEILDQHIRTVGVTARYGGEEFIGYLADVEFDGVRDLSERIRTAIAEHEIVASRRGTEVRLRVTISIGIACYPADGTSPVMLIEMADLALYRAKKEGRNRVRFYDPALDHFDGEGYQRLDLSVMLEGSGSLE